MEDTNQYGGHQYAVSMEDTSMRSVCVQYAATTPTAAAAATAAATAAICGKGGGGKREKETLFPKDKTLTYD